MLFALPEVLWLVLCGTLTGAEDVVDPRRWAKCTRSSWVACCPTRPGVASHGTLDEAIDALDGALLAQSSYPVFVQCSSAGVEGPRKPAPASITAPEIVAIDAKTSRRTHHRSRDRGRLPMASAWAAESFADGWPVLLHAL